MGARKWVLAGAVVGAGMVSGCAHEQKAAALDTERPAAPARVAESGRPAEEPTAGEEGQSKADADLQALLKGSVIYFGFNQDTLTPESTTRLRTLAPVLRQRPAAKILISGNCDERGTEEYNLALGQRRADVAKSYLVNLGVPDERIRTVSYGYEHPVSSAHDESAWAANRRDELAPQGT